MRAALSSSIIFPLPSQILGARKRGKNVVKKKHCFGSKRFPVWGPRKHLLRKQKYFWIFSEHFASSANVASFARRENISGNIDNVSSLAGAFKIHIETTKTVCVYFTHRFWKHTLLYDKPTKVAMVFVNQTHIQPSFRRFFFTFSTSIFTQILVLGGVCLVVAQSCVLDKCHIAQTIIHTLESTAITRVGPVCGTAFAWTETAEVIRGIGIPLFDILVFTSKTKEWKKYESATGWIDI